MVFKKKIDSMGRIVLPKGVRDFLGIKEEDMLDIEIKKNEIVIRKSESEEEKPVEI
jgi:AbrB family looped-hinge helix DNA binding protein